MKRWAWARLAASTTSSRRGLRPAVADVVEHRVVEEEGVLGDQADLAAQVAQPQVGERHAVQPDDARGGIGEARNEIGQRRFAAAVGPDDGHRLAEGDPQVDVVQHRLAGLIGEADALEGQLAVVAGAGDGRGRVADRRLAVQPGEDAVAGRHRPLDAAEDLGELPHRIGHARQQADRTTSSDSRLQRRGRTCGCPAGASRP